MLSRAPQANVDKNMDPAEWRLDALAAKLVQYCYLLEGLTGTQGQAVRVMSSIHFTPFAFVKLRVKLLYGFTQENHRQHVCGERLGNTGRLAVVIDSRQGMPALVLSSESNSEKYTLLHTR